jgi:RNA polymerase sigma-70 factor (ECF subfamily)
MEPESDERIAAAVQAGAHEQFGILIDRYADKMVRYARRFLTSVDDIDDEVQDVFVKAYTNILSFDPAQRFSPWLYRIAHNTFVNALRRERHYAPFRYLEADTLLPHLAAPETTDKETLSRELSDELNRRLGLLDPKYREPLILYFYEDLTYQDIADVLRIPIATVGVRIKRAKEKLRKHYEEHARP